MKPPKQETTQRPSLATLDTMPSSTLLTLLEGLIPIWEKEIIRIQQLSQPTKSDLDLTLQLSKRITESYVMFEMLSVKIKKEINTLPVKNVRNMLSAYRLDEHFLPGNK